MSETLNEIERRVLGVLLEKSLVQPQYYPMSVNAIVAACNQKSNRDPLMSLDEEAVWDTLERLRAHADHHKHHFNCQKQRCNRDHRKQQLFPHRQLHTDASLFSDPVMIASSHWLIVSLG